MQRSPEHTVGIHMILGLTAFSILARGGKGLESVWLLCLVAVLVTFHRAVIGKQSSLRVIPFTALLLFCVMTILSFATSSTANYGLDEVLATVGLALIFTWTVQQTEANFVSLKQKFVPLVVAAATLAAVVGVGVYTLQPVGRFVGTFFDWRFTTDYWPNAWGEFVLLALPLSMLLYPEPAKIRKQPRRSIIICCVQTVLLGSLLLSYSRGAILAFIGALLLGGVCMLVHAWLHRSVRSIHLYSHKRLGVTCAILLGALVIFASSNAVRSRLFPVQSVGEKVTFTAAEGRSSIDERSQFWHQAMRLSFDHPLLGYGPYSFRFVQPRLAEGVLATSDHPHNVVLKFAMERGWPATLAFIIFMVAVLATSVRNLLLQKEWKREHRRTLFLLIGVTGVLLHNMIDYNLQFVGIALPLWMVLGFLERDVGKTVVPDKASFRSFRWQATMRRLFVFMALAALAVAMIEGLYLTVSSVARHAQAAGDSATALKWYGYAEQQRFGRDGDLSTAMLQLDRRQFSGALLALERYKKRNAEDPRVWKLIGIVEEQQGKRDSAQASFERAYELGKWTDAGIAGLLLENLARAPLNVKLRERHDEFITLFKNYNDAILRNTHFIALSRNAEQVRDIAELLGRVYPRDAAMLKEQAALSYAHALRERNTYTSRAEGRLW